METSTPPSRWARTVNRVELLGRVDTDPEIRYTQGGTAVAQLRLATDRHQQNGQTDTDWHSIVCWDKLAEIVDEYVGKGDRLYAGGYHALAYTKTSEHAFEQNDVGHAVSGNGNGAHDENVDGLPHTGYDGNGYHDEAQEPQSPLSWSEFMAQQPTKPKSHSRKSKATSISLFECPTTMQRERENEPSDLSA